MNWWHRAHATPLATALLTVTMLLVPLLGGSALPIPSLLAGMSAGIPVALVLPAIPAAFTLYALNRVPRLYDTTAVRPVARYQIGMLTAAALLATILGLGAAYAADSPMSLAAARNLLGYLGTGLIVQYLVGHVYGPLTVAFVPVTCALIGLGPGGRPFPWTWPLHEASSPIAATASLLLLTAGIAATTLLPPRGAASRPATA
ncbi:hypothetical protein AB0I87_33835 [Streptomyces sp. NPDC049952]|uniref:hypothetical protein n=1 Tax=Streptomyces TaxID=1883 RepID=UPI0013681836|nr:MULTISPECIES: hypothetical protein [unclassified Streptomyces]MDX2624300.1 hypothetical protein [Streptomyces sp. WI03-5b]MEE1776341.1 hypothetical protein [Streptomyces sp. JV181]MYT56971.1 hypothetical protein [Streptomyces sp. SID7834]WKV82122.1 hypothetical protein HBB06_30370 [Streptomyces sp. SNU607]